MGKKLKIVLGVVFGLLFVVIGIPLILFFFAPGAIPVDPDRITGISQFFVLKDGSLYNVRFSLVDANNAVVTSDATANFTVRNQAGQTLYDRTFAIKSTDFQTYQLVLTGAPVVAYAWQIDSSQIANSTQQQFTERNTTGGGVTRTPVFDSGMKTAVLTVTLPNAKTFTAETTFF